MKKAKLIRRCIILIGTGKGRIINPILQAEGFYPADKDGKGGRTLSKATPKECDKINTILDNLGL